MARDMSNSGQYCSGKRANLWVSQKGNAPQNPTDLTYPLEAEPSQDLSK
jgi:hypothetical protein